MLAAAVLALMMTAAAGCGSKQPAENSSTASLPTSQSDGTNAEDASLPGQEGGTDGTLSERTGLEAQGYFDGKEFLAEKVIIEIYE